MSRRHDSPECQLSPARLVVEQGYTVSEAMNVGPTAMRRWVNPLKSEQDGIPRLVAKPSTLSSNVSKHWKPKSTVSSEKKQYEKGYRALEFRHDESMERMER